MSAMKNNYIVIALIVLNYTLMIFCSRETIMRSHIQLQMLNRVIYTIYILYIIHLYIYFLIFSLLFGKFTIYIY